MYRIKEFIENYTEEELAEGGVLALSETISLTETEINSEKESLLELRANFSQDTKRTGEINAKIYLNEIYGEITSVFCNCSRFESNMYACPHITAAQMAWLMKKEELETFQSSPLKKIIAKKTGIEDPFIPGILRKTNDGLLKLIQSPEHKMPVSVLEKGSEKGKSVISPGSLFLEIYMAFPEKKIFEIKVGQKKSYVVKDILVFFEAFKKHSRLEFGKNFSFIAYAELFEKNSRELFDFMMEIYELHINDRDKGYFYKLSGGTFRYIQFPGRYFDAFMELMEGRVFYSQEGEALNFSSEPYKPDILLEKLDYGALLKVSDFKGMICSERWMYLKRDGVVNRVSVENAEKLLNLLKLYETQNELFVSEKDLPVLCRDVLTDLEEMTEINCNGMSLEKFLPEKPVIKLYLDYPQSDMISCRPEACYKASAYPLGLDFKPKENRNIRYEREILNVLLPYFQAYDEKTKNYFFQGTDENLYYFLTEVFPKLEEIGELFISDSLKKLKVRPMSSLSIGVSIESGLLELNINSEEFSDKELIEILSSYNRKKKFYHLKNGSFLKVEEDQEMILRALSECLMGVRKPVNREWKIPLFRALYLDEMLKDRDSVTLERSREYRRLLGRMREAQNSTYELPESLKNILREYQADGFRWIKMLKENGFGGILADDMGLGKTLQILAFLLHEKEEGKSGDEIRTLIITPASLIYNWKKEIKTYTPDLKVLMITGTAQERQKMIQNPKENADIWITSYDLLKRDINWYENIHFANEILDEAQFVKNQTTNAAKSVRLVQSGFRMALTGTPIENRLSELWSIFDYLMPGFLYHYARFREEIEIPIINSQDNDVMDRLHCMVHPFILRRMKKEVLKELPDKLEEEVSISLEEEQRKLYDAHAQRLKMYLEKQSREEFSQGKLEILAELTKLRQLCCHPGMILEDYNAPNAKLEACMEILRQAIDAGHKILIFSQFTSMLDIIGERLKKEQIDYHRIDGSVKKEERMKLVESFDKDEVPVFCISLKAGGTGLNLTAADIVIHFDPWWNLAAQNQATDRTHRIGQKNVVTVYQLIAADTIEEKIVNLQKSKYRLAEDVLSGEGISSILIDQEQVLSLLD